jgi:predicted NBD/HSP70 family sugar kinase
VPLCLCGEFTLVNSATQQNGQGRPHKNGKPEGLLGRNHSAGKSYNRALLVRLILQQGPISRLAISRLTNLSPAAVTILTGQLLEENRLVEIGEAEEERAGRRSTLLDLNADSGLVVGVLIAPRAIRIGIVDLKGQMRGRVKLDPPTESADDTLEIIVAAVNRIIAESGYDKTAIMGVGVGAVGQVQHEQGINLSALSLKWQNVPVRSILENKLSLPVMVDNNARTMAIAEYLFGRDTPYKVTNLALVYVGSGIGGGLVIDGQPYRGSAEAAGEIGHITVVPDGELCYCGRRGCLETVASEVSLLRQARHIAGSGASGFLRQRKGAISLETLLEAWQAGDATVAAMFTRAGHYLGLAVDTMAKVINPETLVLAGPLMDARLPLLSYVQSYTKNYSLAPGGAESVVPTSLGEDIGIYGGAALFLYEQVFSPQPVN